MFQRAFDRVKGCLNLFVRSGVVDRILGSLSIDDEWDDDDGKMTSCLNISDARVSFSAGKMKS